jgi:transcriptional repressor NrdR
VLAGVLKACEKRPVSMIQLEMIADKAEVMVQDTSEREVSTRDIGEMIMNELKSLDKVAYVRFASVYLDFKDVQEFMSELKDLLKQRE